ncbi:MAG: glycosyltransferase [Kiritimatiellae bacterium]|nr:glycosyltransferase [Kiritimatiellia bacterium]
MRAIHQFVAGFSRGDAISNEALGLRGIFRGWGAESHIYSEATRILPELRKEARDAAGYAPGCRPDDVVLLHLSIGSPVNDLFASLRCRKAILYHNVTPAAYFRLVQPEIARNLAKGREQAAQLCGAAQVVMADSAFNAGELRQLGYVDVRVLPLVLDLGLLRRGCDTETVARLQDDNVNVLFVGRCVPNKRIEDLLCAFYYFQRYVEPCSRLIHAGSYAGVERYRYRLMTFARELDLQNVLFPGSVPQTELNGYYRSAHLFLCMSEHEGFCIPLLESMVHDVPVLAYDAGAVRETLDGAGILLRDKAYDAIAELMGRLSRDRTLRSAVIEGQRRRLAAYEARDLGRELREHLAPLLT